MTDVNVSKGELLDEIVNRKNLGDKKFHSESSLQNFGEDDEPAAPQSNGDPGVLNEPVQNAQAEDYNEKRRTVSQPGPISGNLLSATAARAARRRPPRNVVYASDLERNESADKLPKLYMPNRDDDMTPSTIDRTNLSPFYYNGNSRNGDIKSLNRYASSLSDLRSGTPRKRSVATMDAQSIRSVETHCPPPTSPEDKVRLSKQHLTVILSIMYALLLVTLGVVFYLADPFVEAPVSPVYNIVLTSIGLIYQIFLIIDIHLYKSTALKNQKLKDLHEENIAEYFRKQEEFGPNISGDRTPENYKSPGVPATLLSPLKHNYCFSHGRHSGSFYLKLGAAGFAIGHLIHSILLITVQLSLYFDDNIDNDDCIEFPQLAYDFLNPVYCFIQLYFIFKYSNVIILRAKSIAYFGFMHMIGSSLCFWLSTIVRETLLALTLYATSIYGNNQTETDIDIAYMPFSETWGSLQLDGERIFNISGLYDGECKGSITISSILENFSPYLYPFSVEFNILIVAFYYIIWSHIGKCENEEGVNTEGSSCVEDNVTVCKIPTANEDNDFTSNIVIYADCHASNKGLFLGLLFMILVVGQLIIGFVFSSVGEDYFLELGYILNNCTRLGMHAIMLIGAVFAYNQLRKLDVNTHSISLLDDVLLFICMPAFFMETVFSLVATVNIVNVIKSADILLMVIQVIIQTTLLIDGLRRCSNSKKLRRQKPGREVLMFLLIANVGMWLMNTFSYKSPESLDERYTFYGKVLWTILGHVSLPLIMFYRFHSSVCFADIWDYAYKPGSDH